MRPDSEEERGRGQQHKGADEGVERFRGADVDGAHAGRYDAAGERGVEGALEAWADGAEVVDEWSGVVSGQRVESAARCYVAADCCGDDREEDDDEEAETAAGGTGGLAVDVS